MSYSWIDQYGDVPDSIKKSARKLEHCIKPSSVKNIRSCVHRVVAKLFSTAEFLEEGFEEF